MVNPEPGVTDLDCPHCGHQHTGAPWGGICIGCPCPWVPGGPWWIEIPSGHPGMREWITVLPDDQGTL